MGIFDFFRKKIQEPEMEKISFNEIGDWLDKKETEIKEQEKKVFGLIKERINLFIGEIEEKMRILEGVNIEGKKVEERAKIIVGQSLSKYVGYVRIFVRELGELEMRNLGEFVKNVEKIFSDFEKHSYNFYEKATYLIGDEIANVKQDIIDLFEYFSKLFRENQEVVNAMKKISDVRLRLNKVDELNDGITKNNLEVELLNKNIDESKERVSDVLKKMEKIRLDGDYAKNLKKIEEIKLFEKELDNKIFNLKGIIDFKKLSNVFHSDDRKMEVIKKFKENFKFSLENYEELLDLSRGAGINGSVIADRIGRIRKMKNEIEMKKKLIERDEVEVLSDEIKRINSEISDLEIKKERLIKMGRKIKERKEDAVGIIENNIHGLGGVLKWR